MHLAHYQRICPGTAAKYMSQKDFKISVLIFLHPPLCARKPQTSTVNGAWIVITRSRNTAQGQSPPLARGGFCRREHSTSVPHGTAPSHRVTATLTSSSKAAQTKHVTTF